MGIRNFPAISIAENGGARNLVSGPTFRAIPIIDGQRVKYIYYAVTPGDAPGNIIYIALQYSFLGGDADKSIPMNCDKPRPIILSTHGFFFTRILETGDGTSY